MTNVHPLPKTSMFSEEPIRALLVCPLCNSEMCLFGVEPETSKRDLYTFECGVCDRVEVRGVQVGRQ